RFSVQKVCSPRLGVAWSPSPPWKLLPGNAHVEAVVKADALVAETPASASTKRAASRQTARRGRSGGGDGLVMSRPCVSFSAGADPVLGIMAPGMGVPRWRLV